MKTPWSWLVACSLIFTGVVKEQTLAQQPNVILINVDDLGYGDIGPFGNTTQPTPHLDRMATEGRLLASHYAAPVCSPSRASLMTGCYPKRALPIPHVLFPSSAVGLHPDEVTLAEVLREAGYATACIGKWHLGDQPAFLPTRQGFDQYFGLPYSNDMGLAEDGSKSNFGAPLPKPKAGKPNRPLQEDGLRGNAQPPLPLLENEQVVERVRAEEQATLTRRYTERARQFIRSHSDQPFFLYFPHTAVHFPLYPDKPFRGRSQNSLFGDWVSEVDWSVGEVLAEVEEAGVAERTLVIFTSDNGGQPRHGANNGPLRGAKGSTWEGGVRVPTICWWPGRIPAGTRTDNITTTMDWLPTLASLVGASLPDDRVLDGVDVRSVLLDEDAPAPRNEFLYFKGFKLEAVRQANWKWHRRQKTLYDLSTDLGESKNVADQHPEVVRQLTERIQAVDADLGIDTVGPGCRPLGRVDDPRPLLTVDDE